MRTKESIIKFIYTCDNFGIMILENLTRLFACQVHNRLK